jgi:2-aminoethylphosphonate-pyruvate transaminase
MILLNPGPVTLTERVRVALTDGDWCHREPEFAELTRHLNNELAAVYSALGTGFSSVMLTGSGTAAVESMLATFAPDSGGTLVLANGVYGERMAAILKAHRKPFQLLQQDWLAPVDLAAAAQMLDAHPELTHLATVHHETTTGRLNDLDAIGELCRERGLELLLDAVSSFGAETIRAAEWKLAALAATANKCLHAVPGISFVLARDDLWQQPVGEAGSVYLDLHRYYAGQHGEGFSPFTQAVQVAFALREALAELRESGGWEQRGASYRQRAEQVRDCLQQLGVKTLLQPGEYSSVLWSYELPEPGSYPRIHAALKESGFVIYAGQAEFARRIFRIAHMGDIRNDDMQRFKVALASAFT